MQTFQHPRQMREHLDALRHQGHTIALVPTMGALHEGHLQLVDEAARHGDTVLVSIFVNPTQFGPNEDFSRYPRDLESDRAKLQQRGAHLIFAPTPELMYPEGAATRVCVQHLTAHLCGPLRPGHFDGVATVVTQLFHIAGPCTAIFGQKDFQQLAVIRRLVRDLHMPVHIVAHPTVRDSDGLALSSRNAYLSTDERQRALCIPAALQQVHDAFHSGIRTPARLTQCATSYIAPRVDAVDYISLVCPDTLAPLRDDIPQHHSALLAVAVRIGTTRLIDNILLSTAPSPVFPRSAQGTKPPRPTSPC